MLQLHRTLNYVVGGVTAVLIIALIVMEFQSPLVVIMTGDEKAYYQSTRKSEAITEKDVENFVHDYLGQMFRWDALQPEVIMRQVSPLVTSGLADRIKQALIQRSEKDFKGKNLSEDIANIHIHVTDKDVVATFDKVLRIDGIPLVVPTEIAFNIIRGNATRWNRMGLYVNGLVEHEGQKN